MKKNLSFCFLAVLTIAFSSDRTGEAERAEKIFIELLTNPESGQNHILLEEDLNAYILKELAEQPLRGIQELTVKLNSGTFTTDVKLDLKEVELSGYMEYLKSLIEGPQHLILEGVLKVSEGVGSYKTEKAWLNGVPLPVTLVDTLLSTLGRQQEPPFDPTEPFDAPFGINYLQIEPGRALLGK